MFRTVFTFFESRFERITCTYPKGFVRIIIKINLSNSIKKKLNFVANPRLWNKVFRLKS